MNYSEPDFNIEQIEERPATSEEYIQKATNKVDALLCELRDMGIQGVMCIRYDDPLARSEWVKCRTMGSNIVALGLTEVLFNHARGFTRRGRG